MPIALPTICPAICTAGSMRGNRSNARASLPIGNEASRKSDIDILGDTAGGDQDQSLDQLGELVGELHRHSAAQRVTHDGYPLDVEHG